MTKIAVLQESSAPPEALQDTEPNHMEATSNAI